jgi:hypothetical protein
LPILLAPPLLLGQKNGLNSNTLTLAATLKLKERGILTLVYCVSKKKTLHLCKSEHGMAISIEQELKLSEKKNRN